MIESTEALLETDDFNAFVPNVVDLIKGGSDTAEEARSIGGFCSTEDLDRQEEVVVAKGLDFTEYVNYGWFNDNHRQGTADKVGYPTLAELRKGRWWTAGNLLTDYPLAEQIWTLVKSLHKSNAPRRLGFSIEGKVLLRDHGNRILKAKIRNVAITGDPVNTACLFSILAKSFAPVDDVVRASENVSKVVRSVGQTAEAALTKSMTFVEAVDRLHKLRPDVSRSLCRAVVVLAQKGER